MHDGINRADILSCFLYMRVYSTEPPEDGLVPSFFCFMWLFIKKALTDEE